MADGTWGEIGPGDVASIAPGHDAWVVRDEACIAVDFGGNGQYAKGSFVGAAALEQGGAWGDTDAWLSAACS